MMTYRNNIGFNMPLKPFYYILSSEVQSNFNGSNIFGTMDIRSSSHWGLIIAPGQEANGIIKGVFLIFYKIMECWVYSSELYRREATYIGMIK